MREATVNAAGRDGGRAPQGAAPFWAL